jgi:predicted restriction endonuclease
LIFNDIPVGDELRMARQRKGQSRVRQVTLINYMNLCAFCDVNDRNLLIASHIARWADDQTGRGNLTNLICMCRFHDTLFEFGYFSLADDFSILRKGSSSKTITILLDRTMKFRDPNGFIPSPYYLNQHRRRHNY